MNKNPDFWYKDGVIYQVHVKAFKDSTSDGMGDLNGLTQKLDYIKSLGVSILWLLPFYPSPLKDDGYDIADYMNINPDYGTIEDFKKLISEAHKREIKIITELVLNHTSDQHFWFKRARKSKPGSPERNFYVWNDNPNKYSDARIIFSDFETSNWTWDSVANAYYWHRFYSHQPDLNFKNPEVHKQLLQVVDYWFELGVDGLRLDAVPYLYEREGTNCENLPETHEFLKKLNTHIKNKFKNKILLAEANQWPEDAVVYFGNGDECHMAFHFPVMPRMYMALQMETRFPIIDIIEQTPPIPDICQWAMFLRNHDELTLEMVTDEERDYMYRYYAKDKTARVNLGIRRRLAPLVDNNRRKIELLNILLFSFPGTPIIYYGDEIGMGDNYYLGDRHGVRTPMQWSTDRNAGFSSSNPQKLYLPVIVDPEYHYETLNVEVQNRNSSSLLWWMKKTISFRNNHKAFGRGKIEFLSPSNSKVLAFIRRFEDEKILVVANLSRFPQVAELDLSQFKGNIPIEIFSRNEFPPIGDLYYMLTLNAYDYFWFLISDKKEGEVIVKKEIPVLKISEKYEEIFLEDNLEVLKDIIIPDCLEQMQISINRSKIQNVELTDLINLTDKIFLLVIRINYLDNPAENYFLFTGIIENLLYNIKDADPKEVLAVVNNKVSEFYLVNCFYSDELRKELSKILFSKKSIPGIKGEFNNSHPNKNIDNQLSVKILKEDKNFISLLTDEQFILKFYKKSEEGINPEEEI
ncbi:MAG TPA: maltose alpha-D-glucosyltransferase, partial [Ignavibacteriaceae bacterium]|nr:maltose alpha-D-glucosyltransferase [Ignavibacteriaceae bacterium]